MFRDNHQPTNTQSNVYESIEQILYLLEKLKKRVKKLFYIIISCFSHYFKPQIFNKVMHCLKSVIVIEIKLDSKPLQRQMQYQQAKFDSNNKRRAVVRSMVFPENGGVISPKNKPNIMGLGETAQLKKQTMTSSEVTNGFSATGNTMNYSSNTSTYPFNSYASSNQNRTTSQVNYNSQSYMVKGLISPHKLETKGEICPEESPKGKLDFKISTVQMEQVLQQVVEQIKEKHLPEWFSKINKEIYEEIHQLRSEFQSFKEQARAQLKKHEQNINQMLYLQPPTTSKVKGVQELETYSFLLQGKISKIEQKLNHNQLKFEQEFLELNSRIVSKVKTEQCKSSSVLASFPALSFQYRQIVNPLNPKGSQTVLSSNIYHIDKEGWLLDESSHYLLDPTGHQIRLNKQHMQLLLHHNLLKLA